MDKPIPEAVVLARGWLHRRGPGDDYDLHDEASGAGKDCHGCIPCIIVRADAFAQQPDHLVDANKMVAQQPAAVALSRKYPDDGNGDDDAYNRGWNECLDALATQHQEPTTNG